MTMRSISVGIREFRARLAEYLLKSDKPVAVTRHGETIGYFIPARAGRTELDRAALKKAASKMEELLEGEGLSEPETRGDRPRLQGMAQVPEVTAKRALVLDANILLRGVLGSRVRTLIERYADRLSLVTAQSCVEDARKYLPDLCARRGWAAGPALELLEALLTGIQVVEDALLAEFEAAARERLALRDLDDWPALALALAINAPVWTEDTDFFGTGVATWTTRNVEIYLGEA